MNGLPLGRHTLPEGIQILKQCPLCKERYDDAGIHAREEGQGTYIVHARCPQCQHGLLALVSVSQLGMSSVATLTDLDATDVVRFRHKQAVTEDDVLNFYQLLKRQKSFETYILKHGASA